MELFVENCCDKDLLINSNLEEMELNERFWDNIFPMLKILDVAKLLVRDWVVNLKLIGNLNREEAEEIDWDNSLLSNKILDEIEFEDNDWERNLLMPKILCVA